MKKIILFDFDGVIFNSTRQKTLAFEDVYKNEATDNELKTIIKYHQDNFGINRVNKFKYYENNVFRRSYSETRITELCTSFEKALELRLKNAKVFKGVTTLLQRLREENLNLLIVSGAPRDEILKTLIKFNLTIFFTEIFDGTDTKSNHINIILKKYNIEKKETLLLGDATTDLNAAIECNIDFIAVNPSFKKNKYELMRFSQINDLNLNFNEVKKFL